MTQVQIESIGTVTVAIGVSGSPYIMVERVTPQGNSTLVPFEFSATRLNNLIDKGYTVVDPQHLVTCPGCGALVDYGAMECDGCARQYRDYQNEKWTQSKLLGGMR